MPAEDCVKCGGVLEEGFVVDHTDPNYRVQASWAPGQARRSLLRGVKLDEGMYPVVTLRCVDCGYLESYAPSA